VLSMVQHPNIVQLYSYLTDMVEVAGEAGMDESLRAAPPLDRCGGRKRRPRRGEADGRARRRGGAPPASPYATPLTPRRRPLPQPPPPVQPMRAAPGPRYSLDSGSPCCTAGLSRVLYRRLLPGEGDQQGVEPCNILVLEARRGRAQRAALCGARAAGGGRRFAGRDEWPGPSAPDPEGRPGACRRWPRRAPPTTSRHRLPPPIHPHPQYCDRGSLRAAVRAGTFHPARADGAAAAFDLRAAVGALLDVAHAVHYLHGMGVVHGDIKVGGRVRACVCALALVCVCCACVLARVCMCVWCVCVLKGCVHL
jgi:hypothetical protein